MSGQQGLEGVPQINQGTDSLDPVYGPDMVLRGVSSGIVPEIVVPGRIEEESDTNNL